jgi:uncharacterized protein (TIGR02996 family)
MLLEEAFLQAIHDNPDDEASWLALADWLDERDDARGEVVRLQRGLRRAADDAARRVREARLLELLAAGVRPVVPTVGNSVGMTLALVPAGTFHMGSPDDEDGHSSNEGPRHQVEISRAFYAGVTTVTQEQYRAVTGHNPSHYAPTGNRADEVHNLDTRHFPVDNVSWEDAVAFCRKLSELPAEQDAGRAYRLPTEAEWEYACRADVCSCPFAFGPSLCSKQANFNGHMPSRGGEAGPNLGRTTRVASYAANAFGLCDTHGNVWEWCADWFATGAYLGDARRDPQGPQGGTMRVLRGGSCWSHANNCRSANRGVFGARSSDASTGFRVVMEQAR